ncbi:unnamed protein product [Darwinula stevensoni]|uniref:alpha-amylase n=1 Tax=Darwinula stevensoni TaxID=69355 RepID=A0A7R9A3D1_9CRUS|nr:unnamed protein product [Darwinula stevensoni]CAG0891410.1 unnamed protein product [Darwinula stevensoni]
MKSLILLCLLSPLVKGQWDPNAQSGRSTFVHLFEWRWEDIAAECERFLGPKGFAGIQVSPPGENVIAWYDSGPQRPWWERYQPVSYRLETRSGSESQFQDMVSRCNAAGVRIYVDAVINHMTGWWPSGTPATGGSSFDAGSLSYPDFSGSDFNGPNECPSASGNIENYQNPIEVRNCKLVGLNDLKQNSDYVAGVLAGYMNKLIDYGVAGFRIDASKHMWPGDLGSIFSRLSNLNTNHGFPSGTRPFIFQEVIDLGGEPITGSEYVGNGRVTEFKYGKFLGEIFRKQNQLQYVENFGEGWGMLAGGNAVVFTDNHDNQRGHGAGGDMILTFRVPRLYKMANAFMLAWPYGYPKVMSSYYWDQNWQGGQDQNDWVGPPHDGNYNTLPVTINGDGSCGNGWICEHRWRQITNMVQFRNNVGLEPVENFWSGTAHQIAFSRGSSGFIAINNDDSASIQGDFMTGLPAGDYCDVISGSLENGSCTGKVITVNGSGMANINISASEEDPVIAIHTGAKRGERAPGRHVKVIQDFKMKSLILLCLLGPLVKGQWDPNVQSGRSTFVHLFEWRWEDIAAECERFLGPKGFAGVQVSPPSENVVAWYNDGPKRPWWERYQPVSYKLETRSGSESQFQDMVARCNAVGVRIYVDAVINHMTGGWPSGTPATGGSYFDSGSLNYPDYSGWDFNGPNECHSWSGNIENYQNPSEVRNCKLVGLNDLKQSNSYVSGVLVGYMNKLISYGVAGFRIDASKHMWPGDLGSIFSRLSNLNTNHGFPSGTRPFIFQEVIDLGGEPITGSEYVGNGRVTEFKYGKFLGEIFRKRNQLMWVQNFGEGWGMLPGSTAVVFVDNHDNQRGHGAGGDMILTFRVSRLYKMANAFMLAWPYGFPKIMSSYYWDQNWQGGQDKNDWIGPPHDGNYNTLPVSINWDGTCGNGWICEHRWRQITNMVQFRNYAGFEPVENFWSGTAHQIAFSRGSSGFIAINNDDSASIQGNFMTGLPAGDYCDVISGSLENGSCTGKVITVNGGGMAYINISAFDEDPVIAIHVGVRLRKMR